MLLFLGGRTTEVFGYYFRLLLFPACVERAHHQVLLELAFKVPSMQLLTSVYLIESVIFFIWLFRLERSSFVLSSDTSKLEECAFVFCQLSLSKLRYDRSVPS